MRILVYPTGREALRLTISCRLRSLRSLRRSRLAFASRDGNFERYVTFLMSEQPLPKHCLAAIHAGGTFLAHNSC